MLRVAEQAGSVWKPCTLASSAAGMFKLCSLATAAVQTLAESTAFPLYDLDIPIVGMLSCVSCMLSHSGSEKGSGYTYKRENGVLKSEQQCGCVAAPGPSRVTSCYVVYARQAEAFHLWHRVVRDAAELERAGASLAVQLQSGRARSCLKAWQEHCLQKQMHQRVLTRLRSHKAHSKLNTTFQAWSSYVAHFR